MQTRNEKVMLIDDNDIDLKINSKVIALSKLFDDIIICKSGAEGLSYIKKHINQPHLLPQFILLDIQMPEMDGFEFLELYKNLPLSFLNSCKLAILSSTLDFGDIKKAEANPYVVRLLKKPLYPNELEEVLKATFNSAH